MKRIALIAAVLGLGAAPALAATATMSSSTAANPPTQQQQQQPMHGTMKQHVAAHRINYQRENRRANRETEALNLLEAKGYTQFNHFQRDGHDFSAVVAKNGQKSTVVVHPNSGEITVQG